MKPSDLKLPVLNMSAGCPRLTPAASAFPTAVSDYYQLDELLTPEENNLRIKTRHFMENEVAPIIPMYWETADFPFHIIPKLGSLGFLGGIIKAFHIIQKLGSLGFLGGIIKGHECPGLSATAYAMCISEVARVDASIASFCLVQSCLAMLCIEPDYGSDASSLNTVALKVPGGWVLSGQKRWPGNSSFADVLVVLARNTSTNQVNGFIVNGGNPGLKISKIENKMSMRLVQNCDIELENVFVPEDDRLPGANSFQDFVNSLAFSRVMAAWVSIGIATGVYDACRRYITSSQELHLYLGERKQFGVPLAAFQLNQEKLVRMLGNIRPCGSLAGASASCTAPAWITKQARETVALGRELLGGNGIVTNFHVGKAFCDMETVYTYEGSYEVNALIVAREVTGISSIRPTSRL
ncbi:hypothetical protein HU200_063072 [Digitaria exilis]|uniref:Acyl-CoA dehydrogenase n=1 Tax=Digitaria exilis TaxID=1010633 RepID=A0A835A2D2_9POAL|nr:hypothetical protein HU200_063072 [Digitaria exilis]